MTATQYDYIIIGAGSAGCVLAHRLTSDAAVRVLVIEAGGADSKQEIRIPAAFNTLFKSECDWTYSTEPQPELHGRRVYWPRGKVVGGSSSINAMVYSRANAGDHDGWAALGNTGWGYADLLPYYRKSEHNERWSDEYHGTGGLWRVAEPRCLSPLTQAFVQAARDSGIPANADFNGRSQEGVGHFQVNQKNGRRHSVAAAFLKPALNRRNLTVRTAAHAARVMLERGRARGVELVRDGTAERVVAEREVLLCGGTINSPQLLMLSGIGPADHLRSLGIEVVADLPGVGQNLQDHPLIGVECECTQTISLHKADTLGNVLRYLLFGKGPLTSNVCEAAAFLKTGAEAAVPDLELPFAPVFYMNNGFDNPDLHGFSVGAVIQHPASRGEIRLRARDPLAAPLIQPNYYAEADDLRLAVEGLKMAREIAHGKALSPYRGREWWPGPDAQSDADLVEHVRRTSQTIYHPVGTCRMGPPHDTMSVVDDQLRVRGVEGLRVVDASIFPTETTGHPNAVVVAVAERAADLLRAS